MWGLAIMRVIVCGGRNYQDREHIYSVLDEMHARVPLTTLIHGNARGVDSYANEWAAGKVQTLTFTPLWEEYGKSAGPKRNQRMLNDGKPDIVVAFPGGRGTADMIARAEAAGVKVVRIDALHHQS